MGVGGPQGAKEKVLTSGTIVTYEKWKLTGKTAGGRDGKKDKIKKKTAVRRWRRVGGAVGRFSGRGLGIP